MNIKIIGVIAVLALLLGGLAFFKTPKETTVVQNLGGSSAPSNIGDGCLDMGGTFLCLLSESFSPASTTCSFPMRNLASSTLVKASARIYDNRGDTFGVEWGKAANAFSTTTSLGYSQSFTTGSFLASSTPEFGFGPTGKNIASNFTATDFLNFKVGSTSFSGKGVCSALYMSI